MPKCRYWPSKTPTNNLSKFAGNVAFPKREEMGLCPTNKDLQWYNNRPTEGPMPYTKSWYNVLLMFEQQMFNVSLTPLPISSLVNAANTTLEDMVKFIKYGPISIQYRELPGPARHHQNQLTTQCSTKVGSINLQVIFRRTFVHGNCS